MARRQVRERRILTAEDLARGRRRAQVTNRLRRQLRFDLAHFNVDPVALILGELDDVVYDPFGEEAGVTYFKLIRKVKAWNVIQWLPRVAETRGVSIFALADVPASTILISMTGAQREQLAKSVELLAIPRRERERKW